jgi:phage tail P2-like protein
MSLLPPNSTRLERGFEAMINTRFDAIPIPIRDLRRADTCPEPLLAWLAWDESVDVWDDNWPEETKRAVIAASFKVHLHKGTIGALRRALAALDIGLEIVEWFDSGEAPGTFRIDAFADTIFEAGLGINPALLAMISAHVDSVKRGSQHYSLRVGERFTSIQRVHAGTRGALRSSMALDPDPRTYSQASPAYLRSGTRASLVHFAYHDVGVPA